MMGNFVFQYEEYCNDFITEEIQTMGLCNYSL